MSSSLHSCFAYLSPNRFRPQLITNSSNLSQEIPFSFPENTSLSTTIVQKPNLVFKPLSAILLLRLRKSRGVGCTSGAVIADSTVDDTETEIDLERGAVDKLLVGLRHSHTTGDNERQPEPPETQSVLINVLFNN